MSRTLLLGMDGATFTVLNPLFDSGDMPFLRDFLAKGAHAELSSTVHPITPAAWTSMITGRTPGHHGVFDFIHCRQTRDGIFYTLNMSYDIRCPTLWSILSRRGMRIAMLNFPVSYPPEPVNGVCVSGHMPIRYLRQSVYPPSFYERIRTLPGFDAAVISMDMNQELQSIQHLPEDEYEPWIRYHIQREENWFNVARLVLAEQSPDLMAIIFDGVDKLQHLCWRFLDPALFPSDPSPWEARVRDLCVTYFRKLDGLIEQLTVAVGPEARIFFASDHGFGPTSTVFFANAWLAQKGYLFWKSETVQPGETPTNIADDRIKTQVEEIDWERTSAFALNPSSNGIYVRRADGAGSPGVKTEEYEGFRARLVEELLSLNDPYSGEGFFRRVLTREQAFPGEFAARAPDLTLFMKDHGLLSVLRSGETFGRRSEPWGTHYPEGIFIAGGPGIVPLGRMSRLKIVDVAPILLRSLGQSQECELEGHCPEALFDASVAPAQERDEPVAVTSRPEKVDPAEPSEAEEEVLKRLRAIGYLAQ
jgi:predicted AlkP superfamily phosphohydrolase/phosphomutase